MLRENAHHLHPRSWRWSGRCGHKQSGLREGFSLLHRCIVASLHRCTQCMQCRVDGVDATMQRCNDATKAEDRLETRFPVCGGGGDLETGTFRMVDRRGSSGMGIVPDMPTQSRGHGTLQALDERGVCEVLLGC
jgi:hypothetical protein